MESTVLLPDDNENLGSYQSFESSLPLEPEEKGFSNAPYFFWIEVALLTNVFLAGFDGTITASTYTTIGNEFGKANLASWITTSYLITSTAFQPLYGSLSDVLGRRKCTFAASAFFGLGCLGCSIAPNILILNIFRGITGIGGGGLITLSTIVNSDIVHSRKRGLFQACQNLLLGFGAICGASSGGTIATYYGWRWCFLAQVPFAISSLFIGYNFIQNQPGFEYHSLTPEVLSKIDFNGSFVLVVSLTLHLLVLTNGGTYVSWSDYRLWLLFFIACTLTAWFIRIELNTSAKPIIPVTRFKSPFTLLVLGHNFLLGVSSYAYLFALPLLFQIVLNDSASSAGLRLAIPSLATPVGGITAGILMNRYGLLLSLVFFGTLIMTIGNFLTLLITPETSPILVKLILIPANLGQGAAFPSSLFTFVFAYGSEHQATSTSTLYLSRSIGGVFGVSGVSAIIQAYVKYKVTKDLTALDQFSDKQIHRMVKKIIKSTDNIKTLPESIKHIVIEDYSNAIRLAQLVSSICMLIAVVLVIIRVAFRLKPNLHLS